MTWLENTLKCTVQISTHNSSIIWPVWLNGWLFVYELNGSGFESSCSHLNFRFCACFAQGGPWHLGNCRVWIHFETRTWHKNIKANLNIFLKYCKVWRGICPPSPPPVIFDPLFEIWLCKIFYVATFKLFKKGCFYITGTVLKPTILKRKNNQGSK